MATETLDPSPAETDGVPVWQRRELGGQRRAAAYLWFNKKRGDTFTMSEIRAAVGTDGQPDASEHLNRRVRELRDQGWLFVSSQDSPDLEPDSYRLEKKGNRVWAGEANPVGKVNNRTRRIVLERDGYRCRLCGIGSNEPYPGEPSSHAQITVGHLQAQARKGQPRSENLRAECSRCNEPLRDQLRDADTLAEVVAAVRGRKRTDRRELADWIEQGHVTRSELVVIFDRVRLLAREDQLKIAKSLR